jgi:hypothetical protein
MTDGTKQPRVRVDGIGRQYDTPQGSVQALQDVSFDVAAGEFVCIVGPPGSQKTTLFRIITGLEPATAGTVYLAGDPVKGPGPELGLVFQEDHLFPWRTVSEGALGPTTDDYSPPAARRHDMATEMTAFVIEPYGDPDVFERTTREVPEPAANELRVDVAASSLNPVDYKIRQGEIPDFTPEFPATLHCDVSGVVDAVGEDVEQFEPGDEVYGMPGGAGRQGALADYVVGHAGTFARAPESIPLEDAASLPVVALTAWELLTDKATVGIDDDLLVYGASGGVGHIGVQLGR